MERVHGVTVKQWLWSWAEHKSKAAPGAARAGNVRSPPSDELDRVAHVVGSAIARIHSSGLVHGDLTTSNMMLRGLPNHTHRHQHQQHKQGGGGGAATTAQVVEDMQDDEDDDLELAAMAAASEGRKHEDDEEGEVDGDGDEEMGDAPADDTVDGDVAMADGGPTGAGAGAGSGASSAPTPTGRGVKRVKGRLTAGIDMPPPPATLPDPAAFFTISLPPLPPSSLSAIPPSAPTLTSFETRLVLIDFGLAAMNASAEDKGVDLYVLERALSSTHSELADAFFARVLSCYLACLPPKESDAVRGKFEQVRMRGRKRLAFG
jgi:tRNA A-37 threonylcarbamoyl transferase component Bud32